MRREPLRYVTFNRVKRPLVGSLRTGTVEVMSDKLLPGRRKLIHIQLLNGFEDERSQFVNSQCILPGLLPLLEILSEHYKVSRRFAEQLQRRIAAVEPSKLDGSTGCRNLLHDNEYAIGWQEHNGEIKKTGRTLPQQINQSDLHGSKSPGRRFIRMMITALQLFGKSKCQAFPAPEERLFPAAFWPVKKRQKMYHTLSVKMNGRFPARRKGVWRTKEKSVRSAQKTVVGDGRDRPD